MKIMKTIDEISSEAKAIQVRIDNRKGSNLSDLRTMELLGRRDGLKLALEIISNNM